MQIKPVTTDAFVADVLNSDKPVLVDNPQVAADCRVMSIPTMTLFVDGEAVVSINGARSKTDIAERLTPWL